MYFSTKEIQDEASYAQMWLKVGWSSAEIFCCIWFLFYSTLKLNCGSYKVIFAGPVFLTWAVLSSLKIQQSGFLL